jgi:hypothetical protein
MSMEDPNMKRPADPDYCSTKWAPLTEGIEDEARKNLVAWTLEQEARYLNDTTSPESRVKLGGMLRYIFPTARRAVMLLDDLSLVSDGDEVVLAAKMDELVDESLATIWSIDRASLDSPDSQKDALDSWHAQELTQSLGKRIASSLLSYPRLA